MSNSTVEEWSDFDSTVHLAFHQILILAIVLGRWILPKGKINQDELSQLLLIFIGTGADIVEFVRFIDIKWQLVVKDYFSETIDEEDPTQSCDSSLHLVVWGCWALSLFQFSIVLTAFVKQKQKRQAALLCCTRWRIFTNPEIWGIFVILFLQEIPFLTARIYFIFYLKIQSQTMIFFGVKNLLVVMLQVYRFVYIYKRRNYLGGSQRSA